MRIALAADAGLLLLVFIVLALPFELSKQLFPLQVIEISRIGMALGVIVVAVRVVRGQVTPVPRSIAVTAALLAVTSGLSLLATGWPQGIRLEAAIVAYAAFAFFVAQVVRTRRALQIVAIAVVASAVVVALILVAQTLGGFYLWYEHAQSVLGRRNATFADPNITSRFLALAAITSLALISGPPAISRQRLPLVLLALFVIGVGDAMTQSRAGWLVAAMALLAWLAIVSDRRRASLAVAAFIFGFVGTLYVNPKALIRAEGVALDAGAIIDNFTGGIEIGTGSPVPGDESPPLVVDPILNRVPLDGVRRYLARAGIAMFIDHPATGVGLGGFQPEILGDYSAFIPSDRRSSPVSLPHTEVVRIAAETGVVGLIVGAAFFLALWAALVRAARAAPSLRAMAVALGLAILIIGIASQFEGRLYDEPYLWLFGGLIAAMGGLAHRERQAATS